LTSPSIVRNQQQTFQRLWRNVLPHIRTDRDLPARIQSLLRRREFGSRDRRLYRELLSTAVRHLPWMEELATRMKPDSLGALAWLAAKPVVASVIAGATKPEQVRANAAGLDMALGSYHKAVLAALADVDVAFTRMARNEDKRRLLLAAEAEQKQVFGFNQLQFKAGEVSLLTVLQAQRALLDQQDQLLQAQGQSLTALVSVYKALGGGWGK